VTERSIPIEELLEFPSRFDFKAVGPNDDTFISAVETATRSSLIPTRTVERRTRPSRHGTYISVTLTTRVENADELHAVYASLRAVPGVITVL
jgi:putative lipoic acid-binding regulatory protein